MLGFLTQPAWARPCSSLREEGRRLVGPSWQLQGLPGRLEFPRSVNYVLQIKITTPMTENTKNSSAYSRPAWSSVGKHPSARVLTPQASC